MTEKDFVQVADLTDIEVGQSISVEVNEVKVLICNTTQGVFAVEDNCSHANMPLEGGKIQGNLISCPVHGAIFDLKTGEAKGRPASIKIKTFNLKLEGSSIFIDKPIKELKLTPAWGPGFVPQRPKS